MKQLCLFMFLAASVLAQETGQLQNAKVVNVQHRRAEDVCSILGSLAPKGTVHCTANINSIALTGSAETVALLEGMIRQLDKAPAPRPEHKDRNIEITAYMILGSAEKQTELPSELSGVVKQLKQVFPFAGYQLIETMLVRGLEGRSGDASGVMPVAGADLAAKPMYQFRYDRCEIVGEGADRRIHLRNIRFGGRVPIPNEKGYNYLDTGVNTSVEIKEGQKVVIGKASLGPGKESLFLVLSARVVE
jgi:hypothetical protein